MTGIRWGIIAAATAFILSFGLGLISGNHFLRTFLTALVFGLLFFGVGLGFRVLVNNFFPELLFMDNQVESVDAYEKEKEQTSIALENTGEYAVPEMYRIPGETAELGNIEDLISGNFTPNKDENEGIDVKPEEEYNNDAPVFMELEEETPAPSGPQPVFTPSFGDDDEGLGGLPDLDAFTLAFSGGPGVLEGPKVSEISDGSTANFSGFFPDTEPSGHDQEEGPDRSQYKGNKPQTLEGNFDAKEIAQGLRTLINKEKQG